MSVKEIFYSDAYHDDLYEYRHVILPSDQAQYVPQTHLMTESEWRNLGKNQDEWQQENCFSSLLAGLQMSAGWIHFMLHNPGNSLGSFREVTISDLFRTTRTSLSPTIEHIVMLILCLSCTFALSINTE
jgi:cyclin-dependent kinase regulatory subunit CKS1